MTHEYSILKVNLEELIEVTSNKYYSCESKFDRSHRTLIDEDPNITTPRPDVTYLRGMPKEELIEFDQLVIRAIDLLEHIEKYDFDVSLDLVVYFGKNWLARRFNPPRINSAQIMDCNLENLPETGYTQSCANNLDDGRYKLYFPNLRETPLLFIENRDTGCMSDPVIKLIAKLNALKDFEFINIYGDLTIAGDLPCPVLPLGDPKEHFKYGSTILFKEAEELAAKCIYTPPRGLRDQVLMSRYRRFMDNGEDDRSPLVDACIAKFIRITNEEFSGQRTEYLSFKEVYNNFQTRTALIVEFHEYIIVKNPAYIIEFLGKHGISEANISRGAFIIDRSTLYKRFASMRSITEQPQ